MTGVKRYALDRCCDGCSVDTEPNGWLVEYSDYQLLQDRLREAEASFLALCKGLEVGRAEEFLHCKPDMIERLGKEIANAAKLGAPLYLAQPNPRETNKGVAGE